MTLFFKRCAQLCCTLGLLIGFQTNASAQFMLGGHLGFEFDGENLFLGASARTGGILIGNYELTPNPSLEVYLGVDNATVIQLNADLIYPLIDNEDVSIHLGGGLAFSFISFNESANVPTGNSDTDVGINIKAGLTVPLENGWKPFGEFGWILKEGAPFFLRVGAFFPL